MNARQIWVGYVAFVALFGLNAYVELFHYLQEGQIFARNLGGTPYISDFVNTYVSAQLSRRCIETGSTAAKPDVYDQQVQDRVLRPLVAPVVPASPFYTQYPPYYFALVLPLSWLSKEQAWCLYGLLGLVGAAVGLWYATDELSTCAAKNPDARVPFMRAGALLLGLCSFPMWLSTELGQQSLLFFPCMAAYWYCLENRKHWLAGIITAVASVKLQYLPALGVVGLMVGRWRFVAGAALTMVALLGYAVMVLGLDNVLRYPQALLAGEGGSSVSGVNAPSMQNLRGELCLFLHGDLPIVHYICAAVFVLSLVGLAALWWHYQRCHAKSPADGGAAAANAVGTAEKCTRPDFRFYAATSILIFLMFSLHSHTQDYLFATFSCIWLWKYAHTRMLMLDERPSHLEWMSKLSMAFPLLSWLLLILKGLPELIYIQPFFLWALLLFSTCLIELKQTNRS